MSLDSDYETAKAVALRVLHEALDSAASHPKEINPKGGTPGYPSGHPARNSFL